MTNLERLQSWYVSQCDGDWEHCFGISISTLDNPGWKVDIELNETELEECAFEKVQIKRSEVDWFFVERKEMKFRIACGPMNLEECLAIFCDWAESPPRKPETQTPE
jgi:hypothetical protein